MPNKKRKNPVPKRKECVECAWKLEHDLKERIKELECLYSISSQFESKKSLNHILESVSASLVKGLQFPDKAVAVIEVGPNRYSHNGSSQKKVNHSLTVDIMANGQKQGWVRVGYIGEAEFLEEEKKLLKEVGHTVSKAIEKHELQQELKKYVGNLKDLVKAKTRELEKSWKRYEDLFEYAPDGIVITKLNGDIIKANRAFYRMLHYPEDGSVQLNFVRDKLYTDISKMRPYIFKKLRESGYVEGVEMTLLDANGNRCPAIGSYIFIDIDGRRCVEAVYKDIRQRKLLERKLIVQNENLEKIVRKRTEDLENQKNLLVTKNQELLNMAEELNESKNKLQALFDAITDTVVMIDTDYNIKMSNRRDFVNSGKCYRRVFNLNKPCEDCPQPQVRQLKKSIPLEKKLGDDYYQLQVYPILNGDNEVEAILEISRSITKQKNMELQLLQTDKLAALGQLVSGIAHEINNPNTFIRGNVTIVQEAMNDILPILDRIYQQQSDLRIARLNYDVFRQNIPILIQDMAQGTNRIKTIVEGLRKFAKRDDGTLNDDVSLNAIIESCLRLTANQIGRSARVKLNLDPALPLFKGNSQRLEQVVVNILINASQAMENKKGTITISTSFQEKNQQLLLKISDDGKGIDEKTMKQIFDPFFTTKRHQGGTGLGLSIALSIIEQHKGRIEVQSQVGVGTTFQIHLPAQPDQGTAEKK